MARSPAFQLNVADFRQDPKTIVMNATEIGAYFLLILECWDKDNSLPDDIQLLADIARVPQSRFQPMWDRKIKRCFQFNAGSKTFSHKRHEKEIRKQNAWSKIKSDAGKLGAAKRWKSNKLNGTAMAEPKQSHSRGMADDSSTSKKKEYLNTHIPNAEWAWPMKPLVEAFPALSITSAMIGFIETDVLPGDEAAWAETIRIYRMNHNPATKSYLPEKTANLLSVFRKQKAEMEKKQNAASRKHNPDAKRSPGEVIAGRQYR